MPTKEMKTLCDDNTGAALLTWASGDGLTLLKGGKIDYNNETKFENMFTTQPTDSKKLEAYIANIVAGFSAAIGVKDFMTTMGDNVDVVDNVYLTGSK
jgi:phage terminase large subunit GpA-like protein